MCILLLATINVLSNNNNNNNNNNMELQNSQQANKDENLLIDLEKVLPELSAEPKKAEPKKAELKYTIIDIIIELLCICFFLIIFFFIQNPQNKEYDLHRKTQFDKDKELKDLKRENKKAEDRQYQEKIEKLIKEFTRKPEPETEEAKRRHQKQEEEIRKSEEVKERKRKLDEEIEDLKRENKKTEDHQRQEREKRIQEEVRKREQEEKNREVQQNWSEYNTIQVLMNKIQQKYNTESTGVLFFNFKQIERYIDRQKQNQHIITKDNNITIYIDIPKDLYECLIQYLNETHTILSEYTDKIQLFALTYLISFSINITHIQNLLKEIDQIKKKLLEWGESEEKEKKLSPLKNDLRIIKAKMKDEDKLLELSEVIHILQNYNKNNHDIKNQQWFIELEQKCGKYQDIYRYDNGMLGKEDCTHDLKMKITSKYLQTKKNINSNTALQILSAVYKELRIILLDDIL